MPVEDVDAVLGFFVKEEHLLLVVEIGADEGIAALDVVLEIGENALAFLDPVELTDLIGLAFDDFEEEGELGHFDGLRVDIDAVNVVDENAFALGGGELPCTVAGPVKFWVFAT